MAETVTVLTFPAPPASPTSLEAFAARVRGRRAALGMSQETLAERAGVEQSTISRLERGADPQFTTVVRLAPALEVTLLWLIAGEGMGEARRKGRQRRSA